MLESSSRHSEENLGWGGWNTAIHEKDAQNSRFMRAKRDQMIISNFDPVMEIAVINSYRVDLSSCNCQDFLLRKQPCKHVYRLAMMLGLFICEHERKIIREHAIRVLETLIQEDHVGRTRSTDLLSNFSMGCAVGWFMCVPRWFKDALDIRNTERIIADESLEIPTQGSRFNFKRGYILYRAQIFSQDESGSPGKGIAGIQIKNAVPAIPHDPNKNIRRDHGYVEFDIFLSNNGKIDFSKPIRRVSSQDEFVKILISGPEIS